MYRVIKAAQERAFRRSLPLLDSHPSQEEFSPAIDEAVLHDTMLRALSKVDVGFDKEGLQIAPLQDDLREASQAGEYLSSLHILAVLTGPATAVTPKNTFLHSSRQRIQQHARQMADVLHIRNAVHRLRSGWRRASRVVALPYIPYWP